MQTIAISGLNANDNPASGLGIAKSLQGEFKIIGLSYDPNETANYLDIISKSYLMPYPSLGINELLNRLKEIKDKEKIHMVIPSLDSELPLYIKYQDRITELGIKVVLPNEVNFELRSKDKLDKLAKKLNVYHPTTIKVFSMNELNNLTEEISFPIMVKGKYYEAHKVNTEESLISSAYKIANEWGFPILLQEIVKGDELNLIGLADGKGSLLNALSIKKLTTTDLGKIWTAVSIKHDALLNLANDFVEHTSWRGAFELECIINDSKIYLIEINPRFPSWVYFSTALGLNLPKQLIALANNATVTPRFDYETGKMYVRFTDEMITDFSQFSTLMIKKEL